MKIVRILELKKVPKIMTQAFLLENQVVDILPNLVVRERRALEEGGIVTVADLTTCDSQGRHWHPDVYN